MRLHAPEALTLDTLFRAATCPQDSINAFTAARDYLKMDSPLTIPEREEIVRALLFHEQLFCDVIDTLHIVIPTNIK